MRYAVSWLSSARVVKDQIPCDNLNAEGKECALEDKHTDDKYTYRHRCAACWYGINVRDAKHTSNLCKRKKGMLYKYNDA